VGIAVKIFLFFLDFVVRYGRFWSRLFTYFNATGRNKGRREKKKKTSGSLELEDLNRRTVEQ